MTRNAVKIDGNIGREFGRIPSQVVRGLYTCVCVCVCVRVCHLAARLILYSLENL